ncbi:hypothetical protein VIGAN_11005500 [Vigna angularis var. angularis]|uniref:Uncharacterized protein n=1 Tax=Vigna angularis var. angularis TaxID=157739 RepID=A0A0S3T7L9_PHAAN|nr:hypothetical protein VIGAN_11005500 [Vigna angularis var. angularis]
MKERILKKKNKHLQEKLCKDRASILKEEVGKRAAARLCSGGRGAPRPAKKWAAADGGVKMSRVLGIYLASVGKCQLNYAGVKMSHVLGIYLASVGECQLNYAGVKMSRVLGIYLASVGKCQLNYASVKMSLVMSVYHIWRTFACRVSV